VSTRGEKKSMDNNETYICAILEECNTSSAYPVNMETHPLIFTHCTGPLQFAIETKSTKCEIEGSTKSSISDDGKFTILNVPIKNERLIDFRKLLNGNAARQHDHLIYNAAIDSIVLLLLRYKVLYWKNLPYNYLQIIHDVLTRFTKTGWRS
jgi:hypothetical protein